ncbi:50S ribosomal protein L4 [Legionella israelensis]|uniref:Large ribosomal subunit protein uL4 n=1 Tax=Legionella israelensis TaxID=454 RepID=A0A0W0VIN8_9GAMM|nr:50S ribosomal protein L4 [Legionella israelensis]KTD19984.1 50S ribosomal protein L4 [Legionella israelensis]QBR85186.1 50S ribosomal protein L4 [Legionella israelensis]QBS09912.1 50S ribosomal protein L4 [Legionella israelensis]SCY40254.1 large subunit ribosomal protein L4 [Legionella israelensis DSM 19235]STX59475.1 50S ribosomal protein L4 [Legionella israelensis]
MEIVTKDTNTQLNLNDAIFAYDYNEGLIHQALTCYLNSTRSGNSAQKTRSEVSGGGRKPWSQKGTGRARAGSIRSPIWRSGGVTFASKKRDYSQKLNKKMYKRALRSIISELNRSGNLIILSDFQCQTHKTKDFIKKMNELKIDNALIIMNEIGEAEYLGSRNLANFDICDVQSVNPFNLLKFENVIVTEAAIKEIEEQLQ